MLKQAIRSDISRLCSRDRKFDFVSRSAIQWVKYNGGVCYILPLHLFRIRASFDYVLGSAPVPLRFRSGSTPVPLRFHSGSTPVPLRLTPVPLRFHSGSTPVPLRFHSGSAPVLLRFCSGSAPVPLRSCSLYKEGLFVITLLSETAVSRRE